MIVSWFMPFITYFIEFQLVRFTMPLSWFYMMGTTNGVI